MFRNYSDNFKNLNRIKEIKEYSINVPMQNVEIILYSANGNKLEKNSKYSTKTHLFETIINDENFEKFVSDKIILIKSIEFPKLSYDFCCNDAIVKIIVNEYIIF